MKSQSSQKANCKLDGYLITYNSSQRSDITKINHLLFGRIVTINKENKTEKYYYPGLFEKQTFIKVSNGCYFVQDIALDAHELLNILPASVTFPDVELMTGRDYWKDKIKGHIHNW